MGVGGGVGGRKLVGAVRVVGVGAVRNWWGVVTHKILGISLAPPTGGRRILICTSKPKPEKI